MADFDVTTALAAFLADAECMSLELPHMTTGQRKKAKIVLEGYPELQSESFGFGAERQLHIFKQGAAKKDRMPKATPGEATCADGKISPATNVGEAAIPAMHGELQVRNTFIHFERASVDERVVQSMPHGMFKQCLMAESSQEAAGEETPTTTGYDSASEADVDWMALPVEPFECRLAVGALVMVEGLVKAPAFNGRSAVVQDFDDSTGRYSILFASSDGCQQAKVKEENLRMVMPCP